MTTRTSGPQEIDPEKGTFPIPAARTTLNISLIVTFSTSRSFMKKWAIATPSGEKFRIRDSWITSTNHFGAKSG